MLKRIVNLFRGKQPEIDETKSEWNEVYEQKAREQEVLKEAELKKKFEKYADFQEKNVHVYLKKRLPRDKKKEIIKDLEQKIIVTEETVNILLEIDYLIEKGLWTHVIRKEKTILIFIDEV